MVEKADKIYYYMILGTKGQEWNACVSIHELGDRKNTKK